ncbi:aminodeoxychorismate synthase component I [Candidatus Omnitrophota bacterium]
MNILIEKIKSELTPEEVYAHFRHIPDTALLNSSMDTDAGRFSFLGVHPYLVFKSKKDKVQITVDRKMYLEITDPFKRLKSLLAEYNIKNDTHLPFVGGGIGYFSYDLKNMLEELPQKAQDDINVPDIYFVFYRAIIIFDRLNPGEIHISAIDVKSPDAKSAKDLVTEIKSRLNAPIFKPESPEPAEKTPELKSNFTKEEYLEAIKKVLEHIKEGDIYQACLTQRFTSEWASDPYSLYLKLNEINPSPFSAYLNFDDATVISSSPELFLRRHERHIETRPMKGTRPRGKSTQEDKKKRQELEKSQKDISELLMIVDLERNDIGRVAVPGSVKVTEPRRIETYPTVFQTIAVVEGSLKRDTDSIDVIKAAFPGGSITGCPKVRAMEIIDELEPTKRGIYTGAIGYLSFHDTMDLNIAIRTMVHKNGKLYFGVGGGIVSDSDPEAEYEETLVKARALIESLS